MPQLGATLYEQLLRHRQIERSRQEQMQQQRDAQGQQYFNNVMQVTRDIFAEKEKNFERQMKIAEQQAKIAQLEGKPRPNYQDPRIDTQVQRSWDLGQAQATAQSRASQAKREAEFGDMQRTELFKHGLKSVDQAAKSQADQAQDIEEFYTKNTHLLTPDVIATYPNLAYLEPGIKGAKKEYATERRSKRLQNELAQARLLDLQLKGKSPTPEEAMKGDLVFKLVNKLLGPTVSSGKGSHARALSALAYKMSDLYTQGLSKEQVHRQLAGTPEATQAAAVFGQDELFRMVDTISSEVNPDTQKWQALRDKAGSDFPSLEEWEALQPEQRKNLEAYFGRK